MTAARYCNRVRVNTSKLGGGGAGGWYALVEIRPEASIRLVTGCYIERNEGGGVVGLPWEEGIWEWPWKISESTKKRKTNSTCCPNL